MHWNSRSHVCERFTLTLPLVLNGGQERLLDTRFRIAAYAYNAILRECLRRLALMTESRAYQEARTMSDRARRRSAFRSITADFGLTKYGLQPWVANHVTNQWLGKHLGAHVARSLADRALRATLEFHFKRTPRPVYRRVNELTSVESASGSNIRIASGRVHWLRTQFVYALGEGDYAVQALRREVKFVRIVRRRLNGRQRYFVQLVLAGAPPMSAHHDPKLAIGIDPGPRVFGVACDKGGILVDLRPATQTSARAAERRLRRSLERKRRMRDATPYVRSHAYRRVRAALAEVLRRETENRKTLHGKIANLILTNARIIAIERNSFRGFSKRYGRSVQSVAPGLFLRRLAQKARHLGIEVTRVPASLRLSQFCHGCGNFVRKPLGQRIHACSCGIGPVQRDVYSAWLATMAKSDPRGSVWYLDADQARERWSGAGLRLSAASRAISAEEFRLWPRETASDRITSVSSPEETERFADAVLMPPDEVRDVVGDMPRVRKSRGRIHRKTVLASKSDRSVGVITG